MILHTVFHKHLPHRERATSHHSYTLPFAKNKTKNANPKPASDPTTNQSGRPSATLTARVKIKKSQQHRTLPCTFLRAALYAGLHWCIRRSSRVPAIVGRREQCTPLLLLLLGVPRFTIYSRATVPMAGFQKSYYVRLRCTTRIAVASLRRSSLNPLPGYVRESGGRGVRRFRAAADGFSGSMPKREFMGGSAVAGSTFNCRIFLGRNGFEKEAFGDVILF